MAPLYFAWLMYVDYVVVLRIKWPCFYAKKMAAFKFDPRPPGKTEVNWPSNAHNTVGRSFPVWLSQYQDYTAR